MNRLIAQFSVAAALCSTARIHLFFSEKQNRQQTTEGMLSTISKDQTFCYEERIRRWQRHCKREKDLKYTGRWHKEMHTLVYFQMNLVRYIYIYIYIYKAIYILSTPFTKWNKTIKITKSQFCDHSPKWTSPHSLVYCLLISWQSHSVSCYCQKLTLKMSFSKLTTGYWVASRVPRDGLS